MEIATQDCHLTWQNCLDYIKENIGDQSFKTWFEPIEPVSLQSNVLTIQVPSQFFYDWLEQHYVGVLRQAIDLYLGPTGMLVYDVIMDKGDARNKPLSISLPTAKNDNKASAYNNRKPDALPKVNEFRSPFQMHTLDTSHLQESNLNPKFTFDNFVEGDCNRFARSVGFAIADKPGTTMFNPLMIYGGVGLGKTHLVQAVGNQCKMLYPDKFVLYISCDTWCKQFFDFMTNNKLQDFANFYMQVDVLIIDDVQFFSGKQVMQDSFFHIFNHLRHQQKQIILTSDTPPKDLKNMHERLISRFKSAVQADMQQPDFETRVAIIQKKMQADGIDVPYDVVEYLANSVDTNIRELEGVLISMIAQSSLNRKAFDLNLAHHILKNMVDDLELEIDIEFIQKSVSEYFAIPLDALKAKTRKKEVVQARQVAMYFAKEYTDYTLKTIGSHFGGRDHSTVLHSIDSVKELISTNEKIKVAVEELQRKLQKK